MWCGRQGAGGGKAYTLTAAGRAAAARLHAEGEALGHCTCGLVPKARAAPAPPHWGRSVPPPVLPTTHPRYSLDRPPPAPLPAAPRRASAALVAVARRACERDTNASKDNRGRCAW